MTRAHAADDPAGAGENPGAEPSVAEHSPGFIGVLRVREFRALWLADLQSMAGDQLARVALSILVYRQTGSGFLTAGVYALTFLPALLGSVLLGHLADRLPKRGLLIGGDLIRAVLLGTMALPHLPLWAMTPLLVVAVVVGTPWQAAEAALLSEILSGEGYVTGMGLRTASNQGAQLAGFAIGGAVVGLVGAHSALALDAATFVLSAVLVATGIRSRPRPSSDDAGHHESWLDGARTAFGTRQRRVLLGLIWLGGLIVVPEGLAVPYAARIGGSATVVGLLLAAAPAGLAVGSVIYARYLPTELRVRGVGVMAMLACLPLLFLFTEPGLPIALPLLFLSGAASAYQTQAMPEFVMCIALAHRGQAVALGAAGLLVAQGVGMLVGGALTQFWSVGPAISVCAAAGLVVAGVLATMRVRTHRPSPGASRPAGPAPSPRHALPKTKKGSIEHKTIVSTEPVVHLGDLARADIVPVEITLAGTNPAEINPAAETVRTDAATRPTLATEAAR